MADGGLPFQEAIDFQRRKVNLPTERYDDLMRAAHVRAFTVAGVTRDDMLADYRAAVDRARAQGTGFEEFRRSFDDIVDRTGWAFHAQGSTEEERRNWRARVIYNTNMRTSYMAGRYAQMTEPSVLAYRPYWQYRHNYARHPRQQHLAWNGNVWMASDPIWRLIFPPNGWGCNCDVVALNARQFAALGKTEPDPTPDLKPRLVRDSRTGDPETRYDGIDRGWDYNVGEASLSGLVPTELQTPMRPAPKPLDIPAKVRPADASAPPPATASSPAPKLPAELPPMPAARPVPEGRIMPSGLTEADYVSAFLEEFGASLDQSVIHRDPSGGVVTVSKALFEQRDASGGAVRLKVTKQGRERYVRLLADAIIDPDEIWVDWAEGPGGRPVLQRSYLRSLIIGTRQLFALFRWSTAGWEGTSAYDVSEARLERLRSGALLYRRK